MYTKERREQLNSERISTVIDKLQGVCLEGINKLEDAGYEPLITEGYRSQETQNAYYSQGRNSLDETNKLRVIAGLDPIDEEENSHIITRAKISNHSSGRAFDIITLTNGEPDYDNKNFISMSGLVFENLGLNWGFHFTTICDPSHFELK